MHIAVIIDAERLASEHPMLNRLCVALIDDGAQLTRIIPADQAGEHVEQDERRIALAARIDVPLRVLPWMKRARAERLAESLGSGTPDVLYAVGAQAWPIALELADVIQRSVAIDVWSARSARRVPRRAAAARVGAYVAATESLARLLRQVVEPELVSHVPLGISMPPEPHAVFAAHESAIGAAVIGAGRDVPAYTAMLAAIRRLIKDYPQLKVFMELRGHSRHEVWRCARRLDLLGHVSTVASAAHHRALFTRCDLLLLPERFGEMRSIMLEAMASGMPVVASHDPVRDMLVADETALIVHETNSGEWTHQIGRLISQPERARQLGLVGRSRIASHWRTVDQAKALLDTFDRMIRGGSLTFAQAEH
jgi:glycosyltransferase involved in cell wall biosynthesis